MKKREFKRLTGSFGLAGAKEMKSWLEGGSGRVMRRGGNLLQASICVPRVASIMKMDTPFAEVPVLVDETVQFIDVEINRGVTTVKSPTMI